MIGQRMMELALNGWWLVFNGWIHYLEIDFLCKAAGKPGGRLIPLWIGVNELLIMAKLSVSLENSFFLHILLLLLLSTIFLKIPWDAAAAPLVITGTLYTFIEGYSAVCMYWAARNAKSRAWGAALQIGISILLMAVYFGILRLVRKKYSDSLHWPVSSYLYVLLFPCGFIVILVRMGLKLDSRELERYFSAIGMDTTIAAFIILSGAMAIFLMMIKIFCTIVDQAKRANQMAILKVQLEGQKTYVEEAGKRNREYSKFQHDIANHLLVVSGLMREGNYEKAREYLDRLHVRCQSLTGTKLASTGREVLDILLNEKIGYALRSNIRVSHRVRIPEGFRFDDMDLSIIFANILDNAIHECIAGEFENKEISICTKNHGRFLIIEFANTWIPRPMEEGIGLTNIRNVAAKYQGMAEISNTDERFGISILLRSPESGS